METIQGLTLITTEIILAVVVFRIILAGWKPLIQESKQALLCIGIGVVLAMIIETSVHGFTTGVIASGIGFYGGSFFKEIKDSKEDLEG